MESLELTQNNFCPAPWVGMYYHSNEAGPCCTSATKPMSPNDYLNSQWLDSIKTSFNKNEQSTHCNSCWIKEKQGLTSIRSHFLKRNFVVEPKIKHLELRESNLCNFACRMCNPTDSIKIDRELQENSELSKFYIKNTKTDMTDENWNQILEIAKNCESIYLTGGEPMIMKRYYDLLDYLIENNKQNIILRIYTNCSVYNPIFVDKLLKFKKIELMMSIDAVGEVAEYQRYGTNWKVVNENIFKYIELPINVGIHSTITAYSILDISSLADLFLQIYNYENRKSNLLWFTAHVARVPAALDYANLNIELRVKAISSVDEAIQKLTGIKQFTPILNEIQSLRKQLISRKDCNYNLFVDMTKTLDKIRNQSFEQIFNYQL